MYLWSLPMPELHFYPVQKAIVVQFLEETPLISVLFEMQIHFMIYISFKNVCLRSDASYIWAWAEYDNYYAVEMCIAWLGAVVIIWAGWSSVCDSTHNLLGSERAECWSSLRARGESAIGYWWKRGGSSFAVLRRGDSSTILLIPSRDLIYYRVTMARWTRLYCWAEAFLSCNAIPPGQF